MKAIIFWLFVALALVAGLIAWAAAAVLKGLPDDGAVRNLAMGSRGTALLDRKGRKLGEIVRERRVEVPLAEVSPHLVRAVLAIEDQRFLEHGGVDVVAPKDLNAEMLAPGGVAGRLTVFTENAPMAGSASTRPSASTS